jgi:hypothetical protein
MSMKKKKKVVRVQTGYTEVCVEDVDHVSGAISNASAFGILNEREVSIYGPEELDLTWEESMKLSSFSASIQWSLLRMDIADRTQKE